MVTTEQLKRYGWYFFGIMGVVFFWTGVWDGIGKLPYLKSPLLSLVIGLVMAGSSKYIFKGADLVGEEEKSAEQALHHVHTHPQKHEFHLKYYDKIGQREVLVRADRVKRIEKGFLVLVEQGEKEVFIPIHRVQEILHQGKPYKKLAK